MANDNPQAKTTTSDKSASKTNKHVQKVLESPTSNTILDSYSVGSLERSQQANGTKYPFSLDKDGSLHVGRLHLPSSAGFIIAGGTAGTPFPHDWKVAKTATGVVTVTHTIGVATFTPIACLLSSVAGFATINNKGSTSFDINTFNAAGTATDLSVFFMIVLA